MGIGVNTTDPLAASVHGTNPQNLVEKITRLKIYSSLYWKEYCFGLTAEALVDRAMDLKYFGGTYGGMNKPSKVGTAGGRRRLIVHRLHPCPRHLDFPRPASARTPDQRRPISRNHHPRPPSPVFTTPHHAHDPHHHHHHHRSPAPPSSCAWCSRCCSCSRRRRS